MKRCTSCGHGSPEWAEFCVRCSEVFPDSDMQSCPNCGASRLDGSMFCHSCGHDFMNASGQRRPASTLALILAIVPALFGIYGLAHFYTHRILTGTILLGLGISLLLIRGLVFPEMGLLGSIILVADIALFVWQVRDIIRTNNRECALE